MARAVVKPVRRALQIERRQDGVVGNPPQRQNCRSLRKLMDFSAQIAIALPYFIGQGPIPGGQAFDCISDTAILELQTVRLVVRYRPVGEPVPMERVEQQGAGMISGKRPAGSIGPMHARREPDDQQPCARNAKWGHWARVIFGLRLAYRVQISRKARASTAIHGKFLHDSRWLV